MKIVTDSEQCRSDIRPTLQREHLARGKGAKFAVCCHPPPRQEFGFVIAGPTEMTPAIPSPKVGSKKPLAASGLDLAP